MSDLVNDIKEEFQKHQSLFKTAKQLGVNVDYVHNIVKDLVVEKKPVGESTVWDGYGDPEKRKYLVARSRASGSWDNTLEEVIEARKKYEAGTHLMALGRDGPYLLMYLFPAMIKKPKPGYFTPVVEAQ